MRRQKKKEKKLKKSESPSGSKSSWSPFCRQSIWVVFFLAGSVTLLASVRQQVVQDPQYQVDLKNIELGGLPAWMASSEALKKTFHLPQGDMTIFDENLVPSISEAFAAASWVQEVTSVSRRLPHHLDIALVPRQPLAKVRRGFQHILIDQERVVLPSAAYRQDLDLPYIDGVGSRPSVEGQPWKNQGLENAMMLLSRWEARELSKKYPQLKINKITCASVKESQSGAPDLIVQVNRRIPIYFDAGDDDGEQDIERALSNLEMILFRDPELSRLQSYMDLRWKRPTVQ